MRNRGGGGIAISGVTPPVKAAYLYWAVVTNGTVTSVNASVKLQRLLPTPASADVTVLGTVVGSG